eukprot:12802174-Alexandrium_andersonii.AAC.1
MGRSLPGSHPAPAARPAARYVENMLIASAQSREERGGAARGDEPRRVATTWGAWARRRRASAAQRLAWPC